jgi:glycine C-acetyltransferase/8-amino-7-oxononanoate synthase
MSKDLFDKFQPIIDARDRLPADAEDPFAVRMDEVLSQTEAIINGQKTILAGTNNYMGMTFDADAIEAARQAISDFGTGTTGSRVLNGTYAGHQELEAALKEFYGTEHAIVFSTGYLANLGILSTVVRRGDYVIIDADSHASIYDACAMGTADIMRFRHNDAADLDKRLGRLPEEAGKLVVVEGIYSMLGDQAPLKEIIAVTKKHGASIAVDEAHSMGFCGEKGRGLAEELGVEDQVDFIIGTFSKSVGTVGGFCVSNHPKFEVLRLVSRPYMFTASLPPSVVASAKVAIGKLRHGGNLKGALWDNARKLHAGLKAAGFCMATETAESPIAAVILDDADQVVRFWSALLKAGVYVNMALPPATPQSLFLLRCSVCASHTPEQIDLILTLFEEVAKKLGVKLSEMPPSDADAKTEESPPKSGVAAATV